MKSRQRRPRRELFPFRMAEIAGLAAQSQHEVVVFQRIFFEEHLFLSEAETRHLVQQHSDVGPVGKDGTNRLGDFWCGKSAGGHLIKQRLKQMIIRAIHHRQPRIGYLKMFAKHQPAEASAQNDHMFASIHWTPSER